MNEGSMKVFYTNLDFFLAVEGRGKKGVEYIFENLMILHGHFRLKRMSHYSFVGARHTCRYLG